jgi:hypothetical protein
LLLCFAGCLYDVNDLQPGVDGGSDVVVPDGASDTRDGGGDAASDVVPVDGPAAIAFSAGCGALSAQDSLGISFSNEDFTIAFWMRLDQAPAATELLGVVWRGGRNPQEPGWSVNLHGSALTLCTSDQSGAKCTPDWPLPIGHRIHVGATAKWGDQSPRPQAIWVLDIDAAATTHAMVAMSGGVNNWSSGAALAVGAASPSGCLSYAPLVLDEVRIHHAILSVTELDQMAKNSAVCAGTNLVFGWHFDEGKGASAWACAGGSVFGLSGAYQWIASPFP